MLVVRRSRCGPLILISGHTEPDRSPGTETSPARRVTSATSKYGKTPPGTVIAVAAVALFVPFDQVSAQHDVYARAAVGPVSGTTMDNSWNAGRANGSERLSADPGVVATIAVGYHWGQWRTEVERVWTDQYASGPIAPLEAGPDPSYVHNLATRSWFANLSRVFPVRGRLAPYAGVGFGFVQASVDYRVGSQVPKDRTGELLACVITFLVACGGDEGTFRDETLGYRLFGGADYAIGRVVVALNLGWMGLIGLEAQDRARNGASYGVATDHLSSVFGSIGLSCLP